MRLLDGFSLVDVEDVGGDQVVGLLCVDVSDDEDAVEAGEDGVLQFDLLLDLLEVVVPAEDGIGGCEHRCPGVEASGDAGLCHTDGLLLHGLMDRHSVSGLHLVELVDADDAAVGQHQGSSLDLELASR